MKPRKNPPLSFAVKVVTVLFCATLIPAEIALAAFSDMQPLNRNYTAVEYLSSAGIINGYPDGTFRPAQTVNRAEFLKLVLESSDITTDIATFSGFTDVNESAWYAKYVRKAVKEGWVQGYPDGTFKPENGITKAEGLKIIGKVQDWQVSTRITTAPYSDTPVNAWFTPFVDYAKTKNYLEETGRFFVPEKVLTRGATSEILYRQIVTAANGAETFSTRLKAFPPADTRVHESAPVIPAEPVITAVPIFEPAPALNFTPVAYQSYATDTFNNLTLKEPLPNIFYLDEIYTVEGTIKTGTYDKAFVFLAPEGVQDTSKFINTVGPVNGTNMRIPVVFREPGNYRLGIILGSSGESRIIDVSVMPALPSASSTTQTPSPSNHTIGYKNLKTTAAWSTSTGRLIRLNIFQGTKTQSYLSRQSISKLDIPYEDFTGFNEGKAYYTVENATMTSKAPLKISGKWGTSNTLEFNAANHHFSEYESGKITINALPDSYSQGQNIRIGGNAKTEIFAEAAITRPDGSVEMVKLTSSGTFGTYYGSQTIPAGNAFSLNYPATDPGTYFIELNGLDGEAVLNHPVYQDTVIPLIPDYFDLNTYAQSESTFNLSSFRTRLLNLINKDRQNAGLSAVTLDPALNNLAQLHSEDMAERDFFGHINPDGQTPDDRRIELKIASSVGENLAQAPTLLYAHYGLMRSGVHRKNILDPAWSILGIGIAQNKDDQLYVSEEFSTGPLTEIDLINLEKEILTKINTIRQAAGITLLEPDTTLSEVADDWSSKMTMDDFFAFTSPNGETLFELVRKKMNDAVQAIILETTSGNKLIEEAISGDIATDQQWNKLGIGIKADDTGTLKATLLFSKYSP